MYIYWTITISNQKFQERKSNFRGSGAGRKQHRVLKVLADLSNQKINVKVVYHGILNDVWNKLQVLNVLLVNFSIFIVTFTNQKRLGQGKTAIIRGSGAGRKQHRVLNCWSIFCWDLSKEPSNNWRTKSEYKRS
jgi:hypothetical protein